MIDSYGTALGASPNVYKIVRLLEELDLLYRLIPLDIRKGDQFAPVFLALGPNNKAPVTNAETLHAMFAGPVPAAPGVGLNATTSANAECADGVCEVLHHSVA
jgi:hypothetical protein